MRRHAAALFLKILCAGAMALPWEAAGAPSYTIVKHFWTLGQAPVGSLAQAADGTLFGAAYATFTNGSDAIDGLVFRVQPDGSGFEPIKYFTNTFGLEGESPVAVAVAGNMVYGVTENGGDYGKGVAFSMETNGEDFTVLHHFGTEFDDGLYPLGGIVVTNGFIYGTTDEGGAGYGTVFALSVYGDLDAYSQLHEFDYTDGAYPSGPLTYAGGWLYGIADYGGADRIGTEYELKADGTGFSFEYFSGGTNGGVGSFAVADDGTLFAAKNCGNERFVFNAVTAETLHNFTAADGTLGTLVISGKTLYGTTSQTGGSGEVYEIQTNGMGFAALRTFSGNDGAGPFDGVLVSGGQLFGTTAYGGAAGEGTVFAMGSGGLNFSNVCSFEPDDGLEPNAALLAGGTYYGTTLAGGLYGYGTVYAVNADGSGERILHSFDGLDGEQYLAGVTLAGGQLFGTAIAGQLGYGEIFSVQTNGGGFEVWHSFTGGFDGANPDGTLIAANGKLYGTTSTSFGGNGTVFCLDQSGQNFTVLANYGLQSYGGLTLAGDTFYGAGLGGESGYGGVFAVTPTTNGTRLQTLYSFALADGVYPVGALTVAGGKIFGTTVSGADLGYGAIFALNVDGTGFVKLHSFTGGSELEPTAQLLAAGNTLWGTASGGGTTYGTLFSIGEDGSGYAAGLAPFSVLNGVEPVGGVLASANGLYGTTRLGGRAGGGVIYQLSGVPLTAPPAISLSVAGTLVTAAVSDPNPGAAITQVTFVNGSGTALGTATGSPYTFNWSGAPVGNNLVEGIALDSLGLAATSAPVVVAVNQKNTNAPVFTLGAGAYAISETGGSLEVTVLKSLNSSNGAVAYATSDGTAFAVNGGIGNYQAVSGRLTFGASQASETISIPIVHNPAYQGNVTFNLTLSPAGAGSVGTPGSAVITILEVDAPPPPTTNSFLTHVFPPAPPAHGDSLSVVTEPASAGGLWRLVWETNWRASGDVITGLQDGNYEVEFSPVQNYATPPDTVYPVSSQIFGGVARVTNQYVASGTVGAGSLSVIILPAGLAGQWQLQGETDWHSSGAVVGSLVSGPHEVVFQPVAGFVTPPPVSVLVAANQQNAISATYLVNEAPGGVNPTALDFTTETTPGNTQPYAYGGQLLTDVGYGSGCVVRERVVLTAGHLVFDDATLSYASQINWFFQKDEGTYDPPAQIPAGALLMDGYAAARTNEDTPGVSTPTSFNLDVAALFFTDKDAGGGGYSGYLVSDGGTNWLLAAVNKTMAGYPVEDLPGVAAGVMYDYPAANYSFSQVLSNVYETTGLSGYPGESGAPLFALGPGGVYYPAAIYLGASGNASIFRAIDGTLADIISDASDSSFTGINHAGGGVVSITYNATGTSGFGFYKIVVGPPAAITAGAGWRITNVVGSAFAHDTNSHFIAPGKYTVAFAPAAGFEAPTNQKVTIQADQTATITVTYAAGSGGAQARFTGISLSGGALGLTLTTSNGTAFALERSTNLVNWTAIATNTAGAGGVVTFGNVSASNKAAFYRARSVP